MNTFFMIVLALLVVLTAVIAYNMYQENQYRKKIRSQFGHADQDVLMDVKTSSVRDGQSFGATDGVRPLKAAVAVIELLPEKVINEEVGLPEKDVEPAEIEVDVLSTQNAEVFRQPEKVEETTHEHHLVFREPVAGDTGHETSELAQQSDEEKLPESELVYESMATVESLSNVPQKLRVNTVLLAGADDLVAELEELARNDLIWFDKRFDFMAYVALSEPRELQAIPRLSMRQRFQIIGCTRDGRFQAAEPIPGVLYQAFVIGLQGVSRNGLVEMAELNHFAAQVQQFANNMGGRAMVENATEFLAQATELDELCARVDQTIAIHLVSRSGVQGVELRQALERYGFALQEDGTFVYSDAQGNPLYGVVALDCSEFTDALLASQAYKGFSMLFDVTRVPSGERNFNDFMSLAVKLSSDLPLELVDDQIQPLSTEWLKEVRSYVGVLQHEMESVGIEPAGMLAKRLFA